MEENKTLPEILSALGITCAVRLIGPDVRPAESKDGKPWECDAWDCELSYQGRKLVTLFYTGTGWRPVPGARYRHLMKEELRPWHFASKRRFPSAADVISSLCMDAQIGGECFEDFCANFGYSEDSRKALELYLRCQKTAVDMRCFLGNSEVFRIISEKDY